MGSTGFVVLGFVVVLLGLGAAPPSDPTERKPDSVRPESTVEAEPERYGSRIPDPEAPTLQAKHVRDTGGLLFWKFPQVPLCPLTPPPVQFEQRPLQAASSVAVRCGEKQIQVEVQQNLLGLGRLVEPDEVTLGGCSAAEVDDSSHVLLFESELHGCNSKLQMTDEAFVYQFSLLYNPKALGNADIIRSQKAVTGVECRYPRKRGVSSGPRPAWMSSADQEVFYFALQLMSDDWKNERTSNRLTRGHALYLQASIAPPGRLALRVLVDHCVATSTRDPASGPKYNFIKNHGCLGTSYNVDSRSKFMPQTEPHKIQFQVETLRFHRLDTIYVTCLLKVVPASWPPAADRKSCFFHKRWRAAAGHDHVCACCSSNCRKNNQDLDLFTEADQRRADVTVGPVTVR